MAGGATLDLKVLLSFLSKGDEQFLAANRAVEKAQKDVGRAAEKASGSQRKASEATRQGASAGKQLDSTLAQLAAAQQRSAQEAFQAANAARKQAQAADLTTKEGRALSRQQNQVASAHERAGKSALQASTALKKQDAAQEASESSARRLDSSQDAAAASSRRLDRSSRDVSGSLKRAARWAIAAAGAYIGIHQAKEAIDTTKELALATMGLSTNLGISAKDGSRWAAVAKMRNVDNKAMTLSFTTLSRRIEDAAAGSESALKPFQAMGITQKDLKETSGDFQSQLLMVADAFGKMEGGTRRQASAQKLLGRGYATILPMFASGAKGLREQFTWADKAGATFGQKMVDKMFALEEAQRKARLATLGLKIAFSSAVTPALTAATVEFTRFVETMNDPKLSLDQKAKRISDQVEKIVKKIADRLPDIIEKAAPIVAQSAGRLSIAMAKGLVKGFAESDTIAKLFTAAMMIRLVGGKGALLGIGKALGSRIAAGMSTSIAASTVLGGLGGKGGKLAGASRFAKPGLAGAAGGLMGAVLGGGDTSAGGLAMSAGSGAMMGAMAGPWGAAIGAAIGLAVPLVIKHFDSIKKAATQAVDWIKDHWKGLLLIVTGPLGLMSLALIKIFEKVKTPVAAVVTWLLDKWSSLEGPFGKAAFLESAKRGFEMMRTVAIWSFNALITAAKAVGPALDRFLKDPIGAVGSIMGKALRLAGRVISRLPGIVWGALKALPALMWRGGKAMLQAGASTLGNLAGRAFTWARRVPNRVWAGMRSVGQMVARAGRHAVAAAAGTLGELGGKAFRWAKRVPNRIGAALKGAASTMKSLGKKIVDWIISGIKAAPGAIKDAIGSLVPGPAKSALKKIPGVGSLIGGRSGGRLTASGFRAFQTGGRVGVRNFAAGGKVPQSVSFKGLSKTAKAEFGSLDKTVKGQFTRVGRSTSSGMRQVERSTTKGSARSAAAVKRMARSAAASAQRMKRSITQIPAPMRSAFSSMASDANAASAAFGSSKRVSLGFRAGGVARFASGGLVPAAVSSGELLRFPNGSWATVPGARVAADNVVTALPASTEVYTDHGQGLLAAGASRNQALAQQLPHFAEGGKVTHPRLRGGAPVGRAAGQAGIDSVHKAATDWVKKQATEAEGVGNYDGKRVARWIIPILDFARKSGWGGSVSSGFRSYAEQAALYANRASNPNPVAPPGSSNHEGSKYPRGAVDVSDHGGLNAKVNDSAGPAPGKLKWFGPGDPVHFSGTGHRRGGIIGFRRGGKMTAYQVASVAHQAKWKKRLLKTVTAISGGESGWNAREHYQPGTGEDSYGLMQINIGPGANTQYRRKNLYDPLVNMRIARRIWKAAGNSFNPWSVFTSGKYHDFEGRAGKAVRRLFRYGPAPGYGRNPRRSTRPKTKEKTVITDDLKPLNARAARRAMPSLQRGHQPGAFLAAMEAGELTRGIRRRAVASALVKTRKTTRKVKAQPRQGPDVNRGKLRTIRRMQRYGDRIAKKKMPYQYGGGHSRLGRGDPSFDCSGYVSGILGAGGFIHSPMVVAQGTGLYTLGKSGRGKLITWGVRGSSGANAHTMIRVGRKYYESSSGHGPRRVSGWSGAFGKRHFKGWATGTGPGGLLKGRPRKPLARPRPIGADPRYGTGAWAARHIDGIGLGTGRLMDRILRAGNRDNAKVKAAMTKLGKRLSHVGLFSVDRLLRLQKTVKATIRRTIDPRSPGGRKVTKAEAALIRRSRAIVDLTQGALGAKAGRHIKRSEKIASRSEQQQFTRGLILRRRGVDSSSSAGIRFEKRSAEIQLVADRKRRWQLTEALKIAKKAGDKNAVRKIKQSLKEVNNAIAEGVVTRIEKIREAISATVEEGREKTDRALSHLDLWDRAAAAGERIRNTSDTPESQLSQADRAKDKVAQFVRQRDEAAAAAAAFAKRGMKKEAAEAITTWHEAVVAIAEATADEVELRRSAALGAAQRSTDRAGAVSDMASVMFERLGLEQKLAGTYDSASQARRDFILSQMVPALNAEIEAMVSQLQVVMENGDEEAQRQQRNALEQKRNELLQLQLDAQEQIAENTDPRSIGGALAFQFGGENLTDQLLLGANGI